MEACDGLALLPTAAPSIGELAGHLLLCFVVFDAFYFYWHRLHHLSPPLYKHIHSVHHEYRAPFCWVTQHEHVLELLPVAFWSVLVPLALHTHPLTQWAFMMLATLFSVEAHAGYNLGVGAAIEAVCERLLGGSGRGQALFVSWSKHHDTHHRLPSSNFEPFFTHLDRAFGSLHVTAAGGGTAKAGGDDGGGASSGAGAVVGKPGSGTKSE